MKKLALTFVVMFVFSATAFAAKTTYIVTNHRLNYVKLKEVKGGVAEERMMTHPVKLSEEGLRAALASVKLSRTFIIKKETDTQRVFDDHSIDFLAPALVQAFSQATPREEVVFSYLSKNPLIILRNDRLSIADMWVHENELHIKFEKLYAKITMDIDKRGNEVRAVANARGLRVQLELGPGQKMGLKDTEEIVLDLNYNYVEAPEEEKQKMGMTMSGEQVPLGETEAGEAPAEKTEKPEKAEKPKTKSAVKKGDQKSDSGAVTATATPPPAPKSVKERLEELDSLKKQGLIDKEEYKEKKKEILKDL